MDDIVQELGQTPKQLLDELEHDLVKLINKHSFMGVFTLQDIFTCPLALCSCDAGQHTLFVKQRACCLAIGCCFPVQMQHCLEEGCEPWHSAYTDTLLTCGVLTLQVVSAACKALASLATHAISAAEVLTACAQNYLAALRQSGSSLSAFCSRCSHLPC